MPSVPKLGSEYSMKTHASSSKEYTGLEKTRARGNNVRRA